MADLELTLNSDEIFIPKVLTIPLPIPESGDPPFAEPNKIISALASNSVFQKYVSITSNNTITITGPINDIFSKSINFLDGDKKIKNVYSFNVIGTFLSVVKYVAPNTQREMVTIFVDFLFGDPIYEIEITILYNYSVANANLKSYIKKGKF